MYISKIRAIYIYIYIYVLRSIYYSLERLQLNSERHKYDGQVWRNSSGSRSFRKLYDRVHSPSTASVCPLGHAVCQEMATSSLSLRFPFRGTLTASVHPWRPEPPRIYVLRMFRTNRSPPRRNFSLRRSSSSSNYYSATIPTFRNFEMFRLFFSFGSLIKKFELRKQTTLFIWNIEKSAVINREIPFRKIDERK